MVNPIAVASTIGTVAAIASGLLGGGYGGPGVGPWAWGMQVASWRGLPFGVRESTVRRGRKTAVHEYPYRDDAWVEDLGRGTRITTFRGFILGDDVLLQHQAFIAAAEAPGPGTLVHPALGLRVATLVNFTASARAEMGRAFELEFEFVENSALLYPTSIISTQTAVIASAGLAFIAIPASFVAAIAAPLAFGFAVVSQVAFTVAAWGAVAVSLAGDGLLAAHAIAGLQGNFGRFANGARGTVLPDSATTASVIADATTNRAAVATSVAAAVASVSMTGAASIAAAVSATVAALAAACADPADQIRLLASLSTYQPPIPAYTDPLGLQIVAAATLTAALCQRAALVQLGLAAASYEPQSYDDAAATRSTVCNLLDAGAQAAADAADDQSYHALRDLRTQVSADLSTRGADLPPLQAFIFPENAPSLVLAWRLYQDPSRADELADAAGAINPGFMPQVFTALSA